MIKNILKSFLLLGLLISNTAQAGFLIEPYVGYSFAGDFDLGSVNNSDFDGLTLGGRLGYQSWGFIFGLDYSLQALTFEDKSTNSENDSDKSQFGLFVGYDLPILFRAWATYFLSSTIEPDNGGDVESGNGYGFGFGYTGLPFVSLNLEYRKISYGEAAGASLSEDADAKEILFSVSLPLNL